MTVTTGQVYWNASKRAYATVYDRSPANESCELREALVMVIKLDGAQRCYPICRKATWKRVPVGWTLFYEPSIP